MSTRSLFRMSSAGVLAVALLGLPAVAWTQAPPPPRLEPLPEPPPPPPGVAADSGESPIRIGPGADDKVEDVMVDGQRGQRVTTPQGNVYYLVPDSSGRVGTQGPVRNLSVPQWVIKEF